MESSESGLLPKIPISTTGNIVLYDTREKRSESHERSGSVYNLYRLTQKDVNYQPMQMKSNYSSIVILFLLCNTLEKSCKK
jgi:hypothetical protein